MLDRELSMLRLSENEPVQPVLDKMRELYAKLAIAGITYPEQTKSCHKTKVNGHWSGFAPRFWKKIFVAIHCAEVMTAPAAMPCKGHGGIEGVAIAVALTTAKVVAGLGTSRGVVALVQEEEVVTPTMTTVNHA
ncbi:hypothetical protein CLOM_g23352 [Closterium sp. NIES-68]|nr:hypothetical protein CLOM_g23352 [Closterium sp. NIES-68]